MKRCVIFSGRLYLGITENRPNKPIWVCWDYTLPPFMVEESEYKLNDCETFMSLEEFNTIKVMST